MSGNNPGSEIKIDDFTLSGGNVSVQEMARKLGFKTYPNPTEGMLFLEWESDFNGNLTMDVTDMAGRVVYTKNLYSVLGMNICTLDLSALPSGSYGYRVNGTDIGINR